MRVLHSGLPDLADITSVTVQGLPTKPDRKPVEEWENAFLAHGTSDKENNWKNASVCCLIHNSVSQEKDLPPFKTGGWQTRED